MKNLKNFKSFFLNENLKTYPLKSVFKYLDSLGLKENYDYYTPYYYDNKIYLAIRPKYKKNYKSIINKLENFYGWYLAFITKNDSIEDKDVNFYKDFIEEYIESYEDKVPNDESVGRLCFEPNYDKIIDYKDIPDLIYHITNNRFYFKIMKKGLIPKHLDRISYHPDRIFFGTSEEVCIELSRHSDFELRQPIILTVDSKKLKEKGFVFYEDSNLKDGGIYVIENIPPKYIIWYKKL